MNIQSAVIEGTNVLKNKSILSAQLDAEILMSKALNKNREYILLNHDKVLNIQNLEYFKKLVLERATRKPIAFLLNNKFFWKSQFSICERENRKTRHRRVFLLATTGFTYAPRSTLQKRNKTPT